jgi:hypothetical protein
MAQNAITSMPDTNMDTAYSWASDLADLSRLEMTLGINQRTQLILEINEVIGRYINHDLKSGGYGLFEYFSETVKEILLNRIDDLVRHYLIDETNEAYRKSIGLRLWSAAKTITLDTHDGQNTPEKRTKIFQTLDHTADQDPIYRAGVESAPLFKKKIQRYFSFYGGHPLHQ